jgi:TolB-like protein
LISLTSQSPQSEPPKSLLAELRRRRVLRVAGAYVVVAGSLMQAGAVILPAFDLPTSAIRLLILSLAAGFPLAVLLAWILDISPRGIRLARLRLGRSRAEDEAGDDDAGEAPGETSVFARSLEMILLGLALPVLGFAVVVLVTSWRTGGEEIVRAATTPRSEGVASLAVLPLEDLSSAGPDDGFFARGMHEDILTHLARIPSLRLISRTSVMTFAGSDRPIGEIGEALGVEHVLEGSVRRSSSRVRVTAQLIRVATDEHVWAEQFDAELEDVFAVQTRIAESIARALERELVPSDPAATKRDLVVVPAAYDAYQKARDLHRNLDSADRRSFDQAQLLYEEARRLDGALPAPWLQLAILHVEARWFGLDASPARVEQARRCLDEARRRGSPTDQLALAEGIFAYYVDRDYGKALLFFEDAVRLAPGNPEASFYRAMILRRRGELALALEAERRALELDPLNLAYHDEHALTLALAGELEAARDAIRVVLGRDPLRPRARLLGWQLKLELEGDPEKLLETLLADDRRAWQEPHFTMLETVAILAGQAERALPAIDRPAANPTMQARIAHQRAVLERQAGHPDRAAFARTAARAAFTEAVAQPTGPFEPVERRQFEALLEAEEGRLEEAVRLQVENVAARPIESDLIEGGPALWLLAELQARAGDHAGSAASLERIDARMALGSVPFGGHLVVARSPSFEAARRDARFAARLARIRPAYAGRWPATTR